MYNIQYFLFIDILVATIDIYIFRYFVLGYNLYYGTTVVISCGVFSPRSRGALSPCLHSSQNLP